jgi:hypothetical protein
LWIWNFSDLLVEIIRHSANFFLENSILGVKDRTNIQVFPRHSNLSTVFGYLSTGQAHTPLVTGVSRPKCVLNVLKGRNRKIYP